MTSPTSRDMVKIILESHKMRLMANTCTCGHDFNVEPMSHNDHVSEIIAAFYTGREYVVWNEGWDKAEKKVRAYLGTMADRFVNKGLRDNDNPYVW